MEWDDRHPRVFIGEHVLGGLAVAGGLTLELGVGQPETPRWTDRNAFDDAMRHAFAASSRRDREAASTASFVFEIAAAAYPLVVDSMFVTLAGDRNLDLFEQLMAMNGQTYGLTHLFTRALHRTVPRERPTVIGCRSDATYSAECGADDTASFPSGHVSVAAVAAGATCVHHAYLPLYGGGPPDIAACVGVTASAITTGVLRLVADRHWASDVLVGFALGFGLGVGLPLTLHYGQTVEGYKPGSLAPESLRPMARPT
ncbi:MAG: phosphatase PAP2 family protein, partial [Myxococcales bacterium]|nr:phosphatase PAP2 family protein [Myxococcales bacterium]